MVLLAFAQHRAKPVLGGKNFATEPDWFGGVGAGKVASHGDVIHVFILQGLLIGGVGTALGVLFGLVTCAYLTNYGFPINPDVYYIDQLPVHVDYTSVALIGAAGLVISVAATLYPALLAARLRPAAGLRH